MKGRSIALCAIALMAIGLGVMYSPRLLENSPAENIAPSAPADRPPGAAVDAEKVDADKQAKAQIGNPPHVGRADRFFAESVMVDGDNLDGDFLAERLSGDAFNKFVSDLSVQSTGSTEAANNDSTYRRILDGALSRQGQPVQVRQFACGIAVCAVELSSAAPASDEQKLIAAISDLSHASNVPFGASGVDFRQENGLNLTRIIFSVRAGGGIKVPTH